MSSKDFSSYTANEEYATKEEFNSIGIQIVKHLFYSNYPTWGQCAEMPDTISRKLKKLFP